MLEFNYKGRIHKNKLSLRSLRYAATDQAVRLSPALHRRWQFPLEGRAIANAAVSALTLPSVTINAPIPEPLGTLGLGHAMPLQVVHHVYALTDILVTGFAGAMMQDGKLLTVRPGHNWVSALRPYPYTVRPLPGTLPYFNLMAPMPARGHIFHWLFDSVIPLLSYLESVRMGERPGLIVNADRSGVQDRTLDYFREHYGIQTIEPLAEREAVQVPQLLASVHVPYNPRALQAAAGLAKLDGLGGFLAGPDRPGRKRIYISRDDAKLRRVLNEPEVMTWLHPRGVARCLLKAMPIQEQVRAFRNADTVIAPHGAGLAHIVWCRPGTKIVEFFPDPGGSARKVRNATTDYWLISQMRGLDYTAMFGSPVTDRNDGFHIPLSDLKLLDL